MLYCGPLRIILDPVIVEVTLEIDYIPFSKIDAGYWDLEISKSLMNLSYTSYFIKYLEVSYDWVNCSGLVLINDKVCAIFCLFYDKKTDEIVQPVLAPIFTNNLSPELCNEIITFYFSHVLKRSRNLRYILNDYTYQPKNNKEEGTLSYFNLLVDLNLSIDKLWNNLSRSHRRNITKNLDSESTVKIINQYSKEADINFFFELYKKQHLIAAGKFARPTQSYTYMYNLLKMGVGTLFIYESKSSFLSFLYCDHFMQFSRGWSQVTIENIPNGVFPRTFLEWTAVLYYKEKGLSLYHLGTAQNEAKKQEQGFIEFKRRFGPNYVPVFELSF
jgi:hypothetical protein